jgi:hypothetical protein
MSKDAPKMRSWQVFSYARKYLSSSCLYAIFGKKHARAVDFWCQDPRYTARPDDSYDPIKGVKVLLQTLDDHGHCAVVRACIDYISSGTSTCCSTSDPQVHQLRDTIDEEILADYRAVAALQMAIEAGHNVPSIQRLKAAAVAEIERTVAKYLQERGA